MDNGSKDKDNEDAVLQKIDSGNLENSNDSGKENTTPLKQVSESQNGVNGIESSNNVIKLGDKDEDKETSNSNNANGPLCLPSGDNGKGGKNDISLMDPSPSCSSRQLDMEKLCVGNIEKLTDLENSVKSKHDYVGDKQDNIKKLKSIEKLTGEDGDDFIITMNDSDQSDEELIQEDLSPCNQSENSIKNSAMPVLTSQNLNCAIKEKSVTNLSNTPPVGINLPPLPPLPQMINPSDKMPILLPTNNQGSGMPVVGLYIPSKLIKKNTISNSSVPIDNVKKPKVTIVPRSKPYDHINQKLISQTNNSVSLVNSIVRPQKTSLLNQKSSIATPQSSIEMMSLIRWEIANRVYNRPKYQSLQPDSELGPLAKFLFDLGNDLVRETVYNDLVRIQTYRKAAGKLSDKEAEDLNKLKDVQADLKELVGPIKQILRRKCNCGFRSESSNVLLNHQEYPHLVENNLTCAICVNYSTRHFAAFVHHMDEVHDMHGRMEDRHALWSCNLCQYENNSKSKLTQHKFRCLKNFNLKTNLSQNAIVGMEVNFCLENVLYKRKEQPKPVKGTNANYASVISRPQLTIAPKPKPSFPAPSKEIAVFNRPNITNKINTLIDKNTQILSQTKPPPDNSGFEVCEICGGYVKDRKALRIHFYYAHRIEIPAGVFDRSQAPLYCATCFARFWTAQGLQKHLDVHKVNGSSSSSAKCIVCDHKVPNVLMHMRIVHSKELNSYLSASKCIFCGLICNSKKGVENHMVAGHGIMVKADSFITNNKLNPPKQGPPQRGSMCVLCNLHFTRNVDLTRHCMRVHHTCMKCGMVVADKVSLDKHTCLKSGRGLRNCELCHERGFHPAYHVKHIRDRHIKKCTITIPKLSSNLEKVAMHGINIHDSEFERDLKAAVAVKVKIVPIIPTETIEITSDEESPNKNNKSSNDSVRHCNTEEILEKVNSCLPGIPKRKCLPDNIENGPLQKIRKLEIDSSSSYRMETL